MNVWEKKKKAPAPAFDVTQKLKKTWYGGKKRIPTIKGGTAQDEGGNPEGLSEAIVIDDNAKRQRELDWIDRIKEYDALFND